jgi:Ca-activated chloride channel family protein
VNALRRIAAPAVAVAVALVATACGYHPDDTVVHLSDPGRCTPVDVAVDPRTAPILATAATRFNDSPAARTGRGCTFVRVAAVESPTALQQLEAGWPDTERFGPAPVAWVPGSTMWSELLDARLAARHERPVAPNGTSIARSPLVVAMPEPMAKALGFPRRAIGWADLAKLAADPRGWGALGHPEWGTFRLGRGNPNWSTTGLDLTVSLDATSSAAFERALEPAVPLYADSTARYLDAWKRLAETSTAAAMRSLSALVTDERAVVAYNTGHTPGDVSLTGGARAPALPLVAVYPKDATIESDHPLVVLDASWSTVAQRTGARRFAQFLLQPAQQAAVAAAGFRPARGAARTDLLRAANGVDPDAHPPAVAPAAPTSIERALSVWQQARRPARVLVLFDVSASMGDPAENPNQPGAPDPMPTKLARARAALTDALDQLGPADEVGLRVFGTRPARRGAQPWRDVVPSGPYAARRNDLRRAVASLTPQGGSPLYAATRAAFDTVARTADTAHLDAVVVITDGYNEDDHDDNPRALLAHIGARPDVLVFTLAYGGASDLTTLQQLAQRNGAWNYDARDTRIADDALARLFASL